MIGDCQWFRVTSSSASVVPPLAVLPKQANQLSDDELDDRMRVGFRQFAAMGEPCISARAVSP